MGASLVAQLVEKLPAVQEIRDQSLGQEDPLEKEMTTPSSILAWRTPWTEEPGGPQPCGRKESGTTEQLTLLLIDHKVSEVKLLSCVQLFATPWTVG